MSNLIQKQSTFLQNVALLIQFCKQQGFDVTAGELYRTAEQQAIYLKNGRTKTSNSLHMQRLAIDLNFFKDDKLITDKNVLKDIGLYWESLDSLNSWGGNGVSFIDVPHFSCGITKPEWRRISR